LLILKIKKKGRLWQVHSTYLDKEKGNYRERKRKMKEQQEDKKEKSVRESLRGNHPSS